MAGRDDPRVTVRLPLELRDAVAAQAERDAQSLTAWITEACERRLRAAGAPPGMEVVAAALAAADVPLATTPREASVSSSGEGPASSGGSGLGLKCRFPGCAFRGVPGEKCPSHGLES